MFRAMRNHWHRIKRGEPGRRFQDYHDSKQAGRPSLLFILPASFILVAAGIFLMPAPGPGTLVVILGLALLATAWRPAARLLDWAEPKCVAAVRGAMAWWNGLPLMARIALVTLTGLAALGLCYAAYTLWLSE